MKFIKKNFISIILIVFCSLFSFKVYNDNEKMILSEKKLALKVSEQCSKITENKNESFDSNLEETCRKIENNSLEITSENFFVKFFNSYIQNIFPISFVASLLLFIVSIYKTNSVLKTRFIIHSLGREKYSTFLKSFFCRIYRYVWLWPLFSLMIFGVCMINSNFNPNVLDNDIYGSLFMNNIPLFIITYTINVFIYSCIYINIALIVVRKQHNYFLAVLGSYLLFIVIQLFFEVVVNGIVFGILLNNNQMGLVFNILNIFGFTITEYKHGIISLFLFTLSCLFVTSLIVYYFYKDKEKLIIDCEKNN